MSERRKIKYIEVFVDYEADTLFTPNLNGDVRIPLAAIGARGSMVELSLQFDEEEFRRLAAKMRQAADRIAHARRQASEATEAAFEITE